MNKFGIMFVATLWACGGDKVATIGSGPSGENTDGTENVGPNSWLQHAYLKASNADEEDFFASSVAIDGDVAVASASGEDSNQNGITLDSSDDNSLTDSGAVYVYRRINDQWNQEAFIKAPNAGIEDFFGVSMDIDGDTLAVGASHEDNSLKTISSSSIFLDNNGSLDSGAVYVFRKSVDQWVLEAYIKAADASAGARFGSSVAIHQDTIVVGAPYENSIAEMSGAVYIFKRTGTSWVQEAKIKSDLPRSSDRFGEVVAIHQDTIVVGAPYEDGVVNVYDPVLKDDVKFPSPDAGAAHIYTRTGSAWSLEKRLDIYDNDPGNYFGGDVAIDQDVIVVGSYIGDGFVHQSGVAYVFRRTPSWQLETVLFSSNPSQLDFFGTSVDVQGDRIVVGASGEPSDRKGTILGDVDYDFGPPGYFHYGATYLFTFSNGIWVQEAYLKASNSEAYDFFGSNVSLDGDFVFVGASGESNELRSIVSGSYNQNSKSLYLSGAGYIYRF